MTAAPETTSSPAPADRAPSVLRRPPGPAAVRGFAGRYALQLFTIVAFVVVGVVEPSFRQPGNIASILLQSSFTGLAAAGMTLLIVGGMIDLSVAGVIALSAVTVAYVLPHTLVGTAVAAALALGALLGLLNGVIVTKLRFPPFIATFGMLNLYLAAAFIWTDGATVPVLSSGFLPLGFADVAGVPVLFLVMVAGVVVCHLLLHRTRFGRNLRAIGSSEAASRMAGLPVDRIRILAFGLVGLLTAMAGVGLTALLSSASPNMSLGFELNVIAVVVVGGTSLFGGSGTLLGTFTGAILFAGLSNALNLLNVASYWQYVLTGVVLAAALVVAGRREAHRAR
jgi:ribose/xylose/arabinose/galactoside ABC-type transport system permease subunit